MRSLIVILLLVLLPVQLVLASVDGLWPARPAVGAEHQGHHAHDAALERSDAYSANAGDGSAKVDDALSSDNDSDCEYCHHNFSNILSVQYSFACSAGRSRLPAAAITHFESFIADITHPPDI